MKTNALELFGTRGPAFAPGSRRAHSNYGMLLMGVIISTLPVVSDWLPEH